RMKGRLVEFNISRLFDQISERIPDRLCMVSAAGARTYGEYNQRVTAFAAFLRAHGLGSAPRPRSELEQWESGQDHLGIMLYNGEEYMQAMLGCMKARVAPFNLSFRYTATELAYHLDDARPRAVVFHAGLQDQLLEAIELSQAK